MQRRWLGRVQPDLPFCAQDFWRVYGCCSWVPLRPRNPLFTECPAIGSDTGCEFLITLNPGGTGAITKDSTQGPFGGSDDVLVGVLNNSGTTVGSLFINGGSLDIFDFDSNGLCTASPKPGGCPFGTSGYEGPNTSFSGRNSTHSSGFVNFTGGLAPGGTAYFNLEDDPTGSTVSTVPEPSTLILFGSALLGLPALRRLIA